MSQVKETKLNTTLSFRRLLTFTILFILIAVVPAFIHSQWITGPMVNATLLVACILVGPMEAVILGIIPSTVALSTGLLPLPLAPMVPFIIASNSILVAVFHYIYKRNYFIAISIAAVAKFAFLTMSVSLIMKGQGLLADPLISKLAIMMSWPQLATALIGGIIAYSAYYIKTKNDNK